MCKIASFKNLFFCLLSVTALWSQNTDNTYFNTVNQQEKSFDSLFSVTKDKSRLVALNKEHKKFTRWKWFWQNRIDNKGDFTAYDKIIYTKNNLKDLRKQAIVKDENSTWKIIGPEKFPDGTNVNGIMGIGRIGAIVVNPKNKNNVFIGAYTGGVWETKDISKPNPYWECLTNNLPVATVNDLKIVNNILYAATSNAHTRLAQGVSRYGLGIIKNELNENVWQLANNRFETTNIAVSKKNKKKMYAVGDKAIYKSTDGGDNWLKLTSPIKNIESSKLLLTNVEINPFDDDKIIVTGRLYIYKITNNKQSNIHVFQSNDAGKTWINKTDFLEKYINKKITESNAKDKLISLTKGLNYHVTTHNYNKKTYLCVQQMQYPNHAYFVQLNNDWSNMKLINSLSKNNRYYYRTDNVDATFKVIADNKFLIGNRQLRAIDNVKRTTKLIDARYQYLHQDIRAINYDASLGRLIVGTDGGINISYDTNNDLNFTEFTNASGNLNLFLALKMSYINKKNKRTVRIGTQDTGYYKSENKGDNWSNWERFGPFGEGMVYTDPLDEKIVYLINAGGHGGNIKISLDEGKKFNSTKIKVGSYVFTPFEISENNKNHLIFDNYKNYDQYTLSLSKDQGKSVVDISNGNQQLDKGCNLAIAMSKKSPNIFFVARKDFHLEKHGINNAIYKSENLDFENPEKITYKNLTSNLEKTDSTITKKAFVTDIEINDFNENELWLSFGNLENGKKIYHSVDGGEHWVNISKNLPNVPVSVVKFDALNKNLYVGNDYGVYVYNKVSNQWNRYGKGLPVAIITDLEIDTIKNEIIAATHGRSVWVSSIIKKENSIVKKDTTWSTNSSVNGDLIVKKGVALNLENMQLKANNITLEEGARLLCNDVSLISNKTIENKEFFNNSIVINKSAFVELKNTIIKNYTIRLKEKSTLETEGKIVLNHSDVSLLKGAIYRQKRKTKLTLKDQDAMIFFSKGSKIDVNSESSLESIKFCGQGSVRAIK